MKLTANESRHKYLIIIVRVAQLGDTAPAWRVLPPWNISPSVSRHSPLLPCSRVFIINVCCPGCGPRRGGGAGELQVAAPAPPGTEDCLFSWRQNILVRQSGSGTGTGDGGAVTVRTPGVGGGGELDTLQIYLDVLYIISLYHYNNLKLHSQFIVHLELLFYCFIIVAM